MLHVLLNYFSLYRLLFFAFTLSISYSLSTVISYYRLLFHLYLFHLFLFYFIIYHHFIFLLLSYIISLIIIICLRVYRPVNASIYPSIYLSIPVYLTFLIIFPYLSTRLSIPPPLSVHPYLSVYLYYIYLSIPVISIIQ